MVKLSTSNPRYEDVPLNQPPFRWSSDLGYWDATMGAVSDSGRRAIWLSLAIVSMVVTIIVGFIFTSILVNPEARRKPYNLFLVFLMVPDIIFNLCQPPIYLLNYMAENYISVEVCKFQGFILAFGIFANCHINALIALEIHGMLGDSHRRKRYFPPSSCQVMTRCLCSYCLVAAVCLLWALNFENIPARVFLNAGGAFCSPGAYDTTSALLIYLGPTLPLFTIPFGICVYVTIDVLRRGLLPKQGEAKRVLTVFFFRLLLVFLVFWIPTIVSVVVNSNPWLAYVGAVWSLSQGAVSALAMLGKGDVRDCAKDLLARLSCYSCSKTSPSPDSHDANQSYLPNEAQTQANDLSNVRKSTLYFDDFSEEEDTSDSKDAENPRKNTLPTLSENEPHDQRDLS